MTLKQELKITKSQNEKLLKMVEAERQKTDGYNQIIKMYSAYISILLQRLGATKDNAVLMKNSDIKYALNSFEARVLTSDDGWNLYFEQIKD